MEKSITLLTRLVKLGVVNPALYYGISITKNKVQCQGYYNADEIFRLNNKHVKWEHHLSQSGFFEMIWKLPNGVIVELTFT